MEPEEDALRRLGLGAYAARAYLALVRLGPSPASAVAQAGNVPRTRVYAVLDDLVRRDWAQVDRGRPRTYRARRPSECFAREEKALANLLQGVLPALESSYHEQGAAIAGPLWVLKDDDELADRAHRLVADARTRIQLVAPFAIPALDDDLVRQLTAATRRGVHVRALVKDPGAPLARRLKAARADVRRADVPIRYMVVDARHALVTIPLPLPHGRVQYRTLWNPSTVLVAELAGALDAILDAAPPA